MQMERRALYNSLRMHWLLDPSLHVEEWQVADYRLLSPEEIFKRLKKLGIQWDKEIFLAFAQNYDTPEELTDDVAADQEVKPEIQDQIYLLIFELWRRYVPEKMCISIFCDELDHLINRYDAEELSSLEPLEDALSNLELILEENSDQGASPIEIFSTLAQNCANDLETFLYDFIAEQIDQKNTAYASELLDDFSDYVSEVKWFEFLRARLLALKDPEETNLLVRQLLEQEKGQPDLEFHLEVLAFLVKDGDHELFLHVLQQSIPLIDSEDELQEILRLTKDYFHYLDKDQQEAGVQKILQKRLSKSHEEPIHNNDPDLAAFKALIQPK